MSASDPRSHGDAGLRIIPLHSLGKQLRPQVVLLDISTDGHAGAVLLSSYQNFVSNAAFMHEKSFA